MLITVWDWADHTFVTFRARDVRFINWYAAYTEEAHKADIWVDGRDEPIEAEKWDAVELLGIIGHRETSPDTGCDLLDHLTNKMEMKKD